MHPVVAVVVWSSLPAVVFGLALHAGTIGRAIRRVLQAGQRGDPVAPLPIERIAADLRRLALAVRDCDRPGAGVPVAKRRACHQAYEDRLADACAALQIPHRLDAVSGWERAFELARTESALLEAGLVFAPPAVERRHRPQP